MRVSCERRHLSSATASSEQHKSRAGFLDTRIARDWLESLSMVSQLGIAKPCGDDLRSRKSGYMSTVVIDALVNTR